MSDFMDSQFWQKMFMYELTIRSLIQKFNATQSAVPAIILASSVTFDLRKTGTGWSLYIRFSHRLDKTRLLHENSVERLPSVDKHTARKWKAASTSVSKIPFSVDEERWFEMKKKRLIRGLVSATMSQKLRSRAKQNYWKPISHV